MRSPMVKNAGYISNKEGYSELKVMRSAAGFYVGTDYTENNFVEPGSRDSEYFDDREKAERFLETVSGVANPQEFLRDAP